jgi:hypothetical protein
MSGATAGVSRRRRKNALSPRDKKVFRGALGDLTRLRSADRRGQITEAELGDGLTAVCEEMLVGGLTPEQHDQLRELEALGYEALEAAMMLHAGCWPTQLGAIG